MPPACGLCPRDAGRVDEAREALLQRGMRLDESAPGHGIGLAVVKDIAHSYGGKLSIGASDLGGAEIMVSIPPVVSAGQVDSVARRR